MAYVIPIENSIQDHWTIIWIRKPFHCFTFINFWRINLLKKHINLYQYLLQNLSLTYTRIRPPDRTTRIYSTLQTRWNNNIQTRPGWWHFERNKYIFLFLVCCFAELLVTYAQTCWPYFWANWYCWICVWIRRAVSAFAQRDRDRLDQCSVAQ